MRCRIEDGLKTTLAPVSGQPPDRTLVIAESFVGHHEARQALVLSITGVTAILLVESLILLILY
jgi:hypothetical protein